MSYKEERIVLGWLESSYFRYSSKEISKILLFNRFAENNCVFESNGELEFSESLEFSFVRKVTEDEIIIFIKRDDQRKFLEILSTF